MSEVTLRGVGENVSSPTTHNTNTSTSTLTKKTNKTPKIGGLVLNHTKAKTALLKPQIKQKKLTNTTKINNVYSQKLTIYGDYIDLIIYPTPQFNHSNQRTDYTKNPSTRRPDSLWRTRDTITKIILANSNQHPTFQPTFLTLTFKQNITDIKTANRHFKYFISKLKIKTQTKQLHYISVIEFQKRGAVHYHITFFNLPFIQTSELDKLWSHGFTNIRVVRQIEEVHKYVAKYLSKELIDSRLVGQKAYFTSRNLLRPVTTTNQQDIDTHLNNDRLQVVETINKEEYKIIKYKQ